MKCGALLVRGAAAALVVGFGSTPLFAQCPTPGDCRAVHATPGCEQPECCQLVCEFDLLCCTDTWSESCVKAAFEFCEGISCPSPGSCTAAHPTPGCDDYACCEQVVAFDSWCTYAGWDQICAREAAELCGVTPCTINTAAAVDENEPCYRRLNDGWGVGQTAARIPVSCTTTMKGKISGGGPRDLDWFAVDAAARRRYRITVDAEFPAELQYMLGTEEGPNEVKWLVGGPICDGPLSIVFLTEPGTTTIILGAGSDEREYRSALDCDEVNPENPPDPDDPPPVTLLGLRWKAEFGCLSLADIDGDGSVGAADLSLLLAQWGEVDPGLPFDPFAPDADLDGDGAVGAADLSLLLADW